MAIVQEIKELANGVCSKAGLIGGTLTQVKGDLEEANQALSPFVEDVEQTEQAGQDAQGGGDVSV